MKESFLHKSLAAGRWNELSLPQQMANIGSEVIRSMNWKGRSEDNSRRAAERALELLLLTKRDPKHKGRLRELCRLYEVLVNDLYDFEDYVPNLKGLEGYFLAWTYRASLERRLLQGGH